MSNTANAELATGALSHLSDELGSISDERVPLPNDKWIRSTKQPAWALCLDKQNCMYGWKMYELNGGWVSSSALSMDEVDKALAAKSLSEHKALFQELKEHLEWLFN